jgi:ATP/maltotriose-dependent transcriptional regulator MalT
MRTTSFITIAASINLNTLHNCVVRVAALDKTLPTNAHHRAALALLRGANCAIISGDLAKARAMLAAAARARRAANAAIVRAETHAIACTESGVTGAEARWLLGFDASELDAGDDVRRAAAAVADDAAHAAFCGTFVAGDLDWLRKLVRVCTASYYSFIEDALLVLYPDPEDAIVPF